MRRFDTEILVIGGGATGTGLLRDLAMRGFKTILVERRDLTDGTSGRFHGLLHSGGRYAVKDPLAARECIEENRILRRIMPTCIEDTGGFFVLTPEDDPAYVERWLAGCRQAGIPTEELSIPQMLRREPRLNSRIARCFWVPDGAADSFLAARQNAASAQEYGAQVLRYHPVVRLLTQNGGVSGALCHDELHDDEVEIHADLVINAAGAWCGKLAATVGITVQIVAGKGTMLAVAHRVVNTVINRLKMPGDGDILVPAHTVAVIGTTDIQVPDPDQFAVEPWEVQLMLSEGQKIIPEFADLRFLRAWAGVRPLYQESSQGAQNREISRAFVLLDHESRDGIPGLLTITGGKWTTYRKMAEITADKACEKLGVERPCRTHLEELPSKPRRATEADREHHAPLKKHFTLASKWFSHFPRHPALGHRLAHIEQHQAYGDLICECELATRQDIQQALTAGEATSLDDIRRQARLGMGPCQGGFCTLRAAGMACQNRGQHQPPTASGPWPLDFVRAFLQERWKGILPVAWGQQLRQERLNELIYRNVLNADHPLDARQPLTDDSPVPAGQPSEIVRCLSAAHPPATVVVIGGGLAGLTAAWQAAQRGDRVKLVTTGWGATHWASGCVDVLGYLPGESRAVASPAGAIPTLTRAQPHHPYGRLGLPQLDEAIRSFQALCTEAGYPLHGDISCNWLLPTALGTLRPTCLAPETMIAGEFRQQDDMLIVGFEQFLDFWPGLVAANLNALGGSAAWLTLDVPILRERRFVNGMTLARLFDTAEFREAVIRSLKPKLGNAQRVGFPAVLGLRRPLEASKHLQEGLGLPVFEIPGLPPSIPGIRLQTILVEAARKAGARVFEGMTVAGPPEIHHGRLQAVHSLSATRRICHQAECFILATGGILGGGFQTASDGTVIETALGLPLPSPKRSAWLQPQFLDPGGHPIFHLGLAVDERLRPVGENGRPIYENLFAIGGALGECDPLRERSLEGIALTSGMVVGQL